jgi:hypothetical protein
MRAKQSNTVSAAKVIQLVYNNRHHRWTIPGKALAAKVCPSLPHHDNGASGEAARMKPGFDIFAIRCR